jgi:hypothetical protein
MQKYIAALLVFFSILIGACNKNGKKVSDWKANFDKKSKTPYGTLLLNKIALEIFDSSALQKKPKDYANNYNYNYNNRTVNIEIAKSYNLSSNEISNLMTEVKNGHNVLIAASDIDYSLLQKLNLRVYENDNIVSDLVEAKDFIPLADSSEWEINTKDIATVKHYWDSIVDTKNYGSYHLLQHAFLQKNKQAFAYKNGEVLNKHFIEEKQSYSDDYYTEKEVLATNHFGYPDCILVRYGKGKIILHCNPDVFLNHFLLQDSNYKYATQLLSLMPRNPAKLYLNTRLKKYATETNEHNNGKSNFTGLLKFPMWRTALFIAIIGLAMYLIFNTKRRRKIIPELDKLNNTSLEFVETIGQLYYNNQDHKNLGEKMVQHWLENIRTKYKIPTNILDDDWVKLVSNKSGISTSNINEILELVRILKSENYLADEQIVQLYNSIHNFNKQL